MALELVGGILIILVLLNAWTTRAVIRDDLSSRGQRAAQIAFVWLVPFLGALLTLHLKRQQPEPFSGHYHAELDPGYDFGNFRRESHHGSNDDGAHAEGSSSGEGASSD